MSEQLEPRPELAGMAIEWAPIESIRRYWRNPRKNAQAVAKVRASIDEFGWRQPIVVDAERVIIIGDTRYLAGVERGDERVPVHVATDLPPAKVKALRIADNRTNDEAAFDEERVEEELRELLELGADLTTTGLDQAELDAYLEPAEAPELTAVEPTPLPSMTWVLIGIPTTRYIDIAEEVERISLVPDIFCELTANSDDAAAPHRKAEKLKRGPS